MADKKNIITCPSYGTEIDVEEALEHDIRHELEEQYRKEYRNKIAGLESREKALKEQEEKINDSVERQVKEREQQLRETVQKGIEDEVASKVKTLEEENEGLRKAENSLKQEQAEKLKLQRQIESFEADKQLAIQQAITEAVKDSEAKTTERINTQVEMKLQEKDKQLSDLQREITKWKQKAEQGSTQLQGEVQELAVEDLLSRSFDRDKVCEVPKGIKGADCMLEVRTPNDTVAGKILFESKRTKSFNKSWLSKLRDDQRDSDADVAVLVTQTLPEEIRSAGILEGVWVSSFEFLLPVVQSLRFGVEREYRTRASQQNSSEKSQMLYRYLTGNEFRMELQAVIESFLSLKEGIDKERRAYEKFWKEREKNLERAFSGLGNIYGSIKGFAGASLPKIPSLELPGSEPDSAPEDT
jgi:hypothetical protein